MTDGGQYQAGYVGATHDDHLGLEKETIVAMNQGLEPDRWFIDREGSAELKALIAEIAEGRVDRVILRDRDVLPSNVALIGEFFDAATETDTQVSFLDQATTPATEKLLTQLVPLLHEWSRGEDEHFARQGWHTVHADTHDVEWLRAVLRRSGSSMARRWLELLPEVPGEKVIDLPADASAAVWEIRNKRYAADRARDFVDDNEEITGMLLYAELENEAVQAEQTLGTAATAQEECDRDAWVAGYLRRRAEAIEQDAERDQDEREVDAEVLRNEADHLDRRWRLLEGPAES